MILQEVIMFFKQIKIIAVILALTMSATSYAATITVMNGTDQMVKIGVQKTGGKYFEIQLYPYKWETSVPFKFDGGSSNVTFSEWTLRWGDKLETSSSDCEIIIKKTETIKNNC